MIVEYVSKISNENKFYYLSILLACFWFFNNAVDINMASLVGLATGLFIIYYSNERMENSIENLNTNLHYKLESLLENEDHPTPTYFYLEPDIINFFYDIRDFRIYNRDSYLNAIKSTDLLLKCKLELENNYKFVIEPKLSGWQNFGHKPKAKIENNIKNFKGIFETAETAGENSINNIHSFAVSLPVGIHTTKHQISLKKFHILIKRILDDILNSIKKSTSDPLIGQTYGLPKGNDKSKDSFDFI